MRRFAKWIVVLMTAAAVAGCDHSVTQEPTASDVVAKLKLAKLPIGNVAVYDEKTDPNKQLGRPGSYTSKVSWADTRYEQSGDGLLGGTVEVFANADDMKRRQAYIAEIARSAAVFNQYIYTSGLALVRIPHEVTPTHAKEYEAALSPGK